jgi:uncharacterized membrane protein YphA (DoxX/SURF4 family)
MGTGWLYPGGFRAILGAMEYLRLALQVLVATGLLNVWLLRAGKPTRYRGDDARSMRDEFAAYGLPVAMMYVVGGLKILIAIALIAGIWLPALVLPAASLLIFLMLGAFAMHLKVKDPLEKAVPSLLMLGMAIGIAVL